VETSDLLRYAVDALDRLGSRYLVTGSVVAMPCGEPRYTMFKFVSDEMPAPLREGRAEY
jgi:hypothetical protein